GTAGRRPVMRTGYLAVTAVTAVVNAAAVCDFARSRWLLENMARTGLTESWYLPLGVLKAAGAVGLVVGIAVPALGAAAALDWCCTSPAPSSRWSGSGGTRTWGSPPRWPRSPRPRSRCGSSPGDH